MHARVAEGRQHVDAGARFARHRHEGAYAAVVLGGAYDEAGERGRWHVGAGDVVIHDMFDAHCDRFDGACEILNLHLPAASVPAFAFGRVRDADAVARVAERDTAEAASLLLATMSEAPTPRGDWADELVADMWRAPSLHLGDWARQRRISGEHVSRAFAREWGVTPARFRLAVRARRAWRAIVSGREPLSAVAVTYGFADQAHMTRAVHAVTGRTPGYWRSNPFKTEAQTRH